jgi:hypothetical protein
MVVINLVYSVNGFTIISYGEIMRLTVTVELCDPELMYYPNFVTIKKTNWLIALNHIKTARNNLRPFARATQARFVEDEL